MPDNQAWEAIFQRIREHCREQSWYGPDGDLSAFRWRVEHGASQEYSPAPTQGFDFPPATEEQLTETEEILEFALPPALRSLYRNVANGGFGPGYGIVGAIGGFGPGDGVYDIVQGFSMFADETTLVPLGAYAESPDSQRFVLPTTCWPDRLLPLCYWGCAIYDFIDASTGRICHREIAGPPNAVWNDPAMRLIITRTELTLEDWLSRWLDGDLEQPES